MYFFFNLTDTAFLNVVFLFQLKFLSKIHL